MSSGSVARIHHPAAVTGQRTANVLRYVPGLAPTRAAADYEQAPEAQAAFAATRHPAPPRPTPPAPPKAPDDEDQITVNIKDIQGDILVGMKKQIELFYFFSIVDVHGFKSKLAKDIKPIITSVEQLMNVKTQPEVVLNLAFSASGLAVLNTNGKITPSKDAPFLAGQTKDATTLGDPGTSLWLKTFIGTSIHGVFLIVGDKQASVDKQVASLKETFGKCWKEEHVLQGNIRPGDEAGHEHFGWLDGVSQPAVNGFEMPRPGQQPVEPGVIIVGEDGDNSGNPSWMKNGSFLVFRQQEQRVPEFHDFLWQQAENFPFGKNRDEAARMLGARLFGRWPSGAPLELAPDHDKPELGADTNLNNAFFFANPPDQERCPFAAHIRKTRPRADLFGDVTAPTRSIIRAGIPYGPEVNDVERNAKKTGNVPRGLAFVCYQSSIAQGFQFLQRSWANNQNFIFGKDTPPGFDPIIGANHGLPRSTTGMDRHDPKKPLDMKEDFVVNRGGEYFFSPSISAIGGVLAQ